jgi:precorrin-2 dehydrogenase/sirohydrochlorin ferrochelatase
MAAEDPFYPVNLRLSGRRCLLVGGGNRASGPVSDLLAVGARVDVVAPEVLDDIAVLDGVSVQRRPYRRHDVVGYRLVITATDDPDVNRQVIADGEAAGVPVSCVDDPDCGTFVVPSVLRRGPIVVTVGTSRPSPPLTEWMLRRLEAEIGPEYEELLGVLSEIRDEMVSRGETTEIPGWQFALDSGMLDLIRAGQRADAKERLRKCLSSSSV